MRIGNRFFAALRTFDYLYLLTLTTGSANNLPKYFHNVFNELFEHLSFFRKTPRSQDKRGALKSSPSLSPAPPPPPPQ